MTVLFCKCVDIVIFVTHNDVMDDDCVCVVVRTRAYLAKIQCIIDTTGCCS